MYMHTVVVYKIYQTDQPLVLNDWCQPSEGGKDVVARHCH